MNTYAVLRGVTASRTTYPLGVSRDGTGTAAGHHRDVSVFLIEVHLGDAGTLEVERAARMLDAAQARMKGTAAVTRTLMAGISPGDGRLICLVEATSLDAVRRMVSLALLPHGRIREITHLAAMHLLGGHPGSDVDPGVDAELVEDVVHVSLDGPLGQE